MLKSKTKRDSFLKAGLIKALSLIIVVLFAGSAGYYFLFGYTFIDAVYMTILTVATVGFGEVVPLDNGGKIFTSLLILVSIFVIAYGVTTITTYLASINSVQEFKKRKMQQKINQFNNHVIVCGYGRNGKQAAARLMSFNKDFVIIEQNKSIIEELNDENLPFIEGNATDDETLLKAGVKNAGFLISSLPSDADNVFITLTAKQLNPKIQIFSRASEDTSVKKLKIAGAQHVIMPDKIGGDHMASLIVAPDLIEFLDNLSSPEFGSMNIQELLMINFPKAEKLNDLKIREKTGCTVIGYKTEAGKYIVNPDDDYPVEHEGRIIVLGNKMQITKLNEIFRSSLS